MSNQELSIKNLRQNIRVSVLLKSKNPSKNDKLQMQFFHAFLKIHFVV